MNRLKAITSLTEILSICNDFITKMYDVEKITDVENSIKIFEIKMARKLEFLLSQFFSHSEHAKTEIDTVIKSFAYGDSTFIYSLN